MVADVALILLAAGLASALMIGACVYLLSGRLRLLAIPNDRSFHDSATPTAGGLAFVIPVIVYLGWLGLADAAPASMLAAGGTLLALVGLWDDAREVSRAARFLVQVGVCGTAAWWLLPEAGWLLPAIVAVALTWQVNLYNFMDGIDGLAAAQALVYAVGAHVVAGSVPGWPGDLLWLLAGATMGFLAFNWPPARMFMGNAGSYFLGFVTGVVAVLLWLQHTLALPVSLILLSGFWFDSTYTLIVRVLTGQAFTKPHRSHLYQKIAAKRGHLWTTTCFLLYAVIWLLPLSWLCARYANALTLSAWLWVLPSVTPLGVAAWRLRAGLPAETA